jgi:hypothetical protein
MASKRYYSQTRKACIHFGSTYKHYDVFTAQLARKIHFKTTSKTKISLSLIPTADININLTTFANSWWNYPFGTGVLHLIQINHQADETVFQFIILTFGYSSTCFGRFPPIIRSSMSTVAASGFTFVSWWQSCCVRGRTGRPAGLTTNTARLSPRYDGKTRSCHCSHWAPDDGRKNTRNLLSCKQTSG